MKYPGEIFEIKYIVEETAGEFTKRVKEAVKDYQKKGYYVDVSFGGSGDGNIQAMIVARQWIEEVDVNAVPISTRFNKIKEKAESSGDKNEISR